MAYGLMVCDFGGNGQSDISFGNRASVVETRVNSRIRPLHYGVNYNESPLEFKLVFGAQRALDRYELERISMWLTGHQEYQWLTIDQPDMSRCAFRCLITELKPLSHGWLPVAFDATVRCDCPYAYGFPIEQEYRISGNTQILFRNESSVREYWCPNLTILPSPGVTSVRIVNRSDHGREFRLDNLPAEELHIEVNNADGIIRELKHGFNLYDGFNTNFFRMVSGDNDLEVIGDGALIISGRFIYNVAG